MLRHARRHDRHDVCYAWMSGRAILSVLELRKRRKRKVVVVRLGMPSASGAVAFARLRIWPRQRYGRTRLEHGYPTHRLPSQSDKSAPSYDPKSGTMLACLHASIAANAHNLPPKHPLEQPRTSPDSAR